METTKEKSSAWRIFLTGLAGFLLAALVGVLAGFVFFRLGIYQFLIHLVPQDQPLVRLLTALLLGFGGMALAGAAFGTMAGLTLLRVDPQGGRRRYILGGAFAYGITYGILFIPILLLIALIGQYNQGSAKDPGSFIKLFGLIGLIYGLLSGLVLSLITVKIRYGWLPFLISILGGTLGGIFLGIVIWRNTFFLEQSSRLLQGIVFFLYLAVAFAGLVGGLLALSFHWVKRKREARADRKVEPRRAQDVFTITAGLLLLVMIFNLTNTLIEFVTIHTGTTTTSLGSKTQGVGWSAPQQLAEAGSLNTGSAPDLKAGPDGKLASVWVYDQDGIAEVAYAYQTGDLSWSRPVNVSNSTTVSRHPQLEIGQDGRVHVVWSEEVSPGQWEIRYTSCYGNSCNPPKSISTASAESCQPEAKQQDWPAIAVDADGIVGVAWNAGGLIAFAVSSPGEPLTASAGNCFEPVQGPDMELQPRIATNGNAGQFALVYGTGSADTSKPIRFLQVSQGGKGPETEVGQGRFPEIYHNQDGVHLAWCSSEGYLNYSAYVSADAPVETITAPPCINRPAILQDAQGQMHLIWYSNQIQDNYGNTRPGNFMVESIQANGSWSSPAILAGLAQASLPSSTSLPGGGLSAIWADVSQSTPGLFLANQPLYQCSAGSLNITDQAILNVVQGGQFHPAGYQSPFCNNQFTNFIYMPEPNPAFSNLPVTPNGGFDLLRKYIQQARYELLISNMQWDPDQDELSPGYQVIEGVADLYKQIEADPSAYPRGLTVRILLGNYPNLATFQYGDQIWNVIDDLRNAGVEKMEDPAVGWKLEIANFRGSYPHSHTKFIVIDGKQLMAAGFNISWLHYPADHPSGKGDSLTDLGMNMEGPVAQPGMAAFDDEWNGSSQLSCSDLAIGEKADVWKRSCEWKTGAASHLPEVLKYWPAEESSTAFALYRTDVYKEADHAYEAAIASAEKSIDAIHVNFSAEIQCMLNLIAPDTCTFDDNALPWMKSLVQAVEQNHIKVRVIVENANSNGLENRVGIDMLEKKLASLGISDLVEVRFFNGRVHMKTALIDQETLFVGSQNFHYSSFSPGGLLEFVAATDSQAAIQEYQKMFEYYWAQSIPADEATWGTAGE